MSCEDIPSLLDIQKVKKNADDFGRLMGTGEGDSTNGVTGQIRPTYNKVMKSVGFKPGSGDFTTGFTVMPGERGISWYDPISKNWYSYLGVIPSPSGYPVSPGTNPVGDSNWAPRTDELLRNDLASSVGSTLVSWKGGEPGKLKKTLAERFESASVVDFATEYLTMDEITKIRRNYPAQNTDFEKSDILDITARLKQAISDLGGTGPSMTYGEYHSPAKILQLPAGVLGLNLTDTDRILIDRGNILIQGAGTFNTRLVAIGGHCNEMFRFKGAYCVGLQYLTLDGGLPEWPTGTENYGADIPLVLDQVAHWYSEDLHIMNYRHRAMQCIHAWECYQGSLRMLHGGWFRVAGSVPGGLFFDNFRQEETFFPGSESNQFYFAKVASSSVGRVVDFTSPCFNVVIGNLASENFTFRNYLPDGANSSKIHISGLSVVYILSAWHYYHDEVSATVQAPIFELENCGPGCKLDNQAIFQQIPTGSGQVLSTPWIINADTTYPVEININIDDRGDAQTVLFNGRRDPSQVFGTIKYYSELPRTLENFMGVEGGKGFVGDISFKAGAWPSTTTPDIYHFKGNAKGISQIGGTGMHREAVAAIRSMISFNGNDGSVFYASGATVTREAVGQYQINFTHSLPSTGYVVSFALKKTVSASDNMEISNKTPDSMSVVIRDSSGNLHDAGICDVTIIM